MKLTNPLVIIDIGKITLGKYTFLIIAPLISIEFVPWAIDVVNQVHGRIPITINVV